MTETLGTLLHFKVDKPYESTPVGVPNQEDGTELMLVGEDGKPVAEGEEGELVVKGCFCKGYYKDPERTAQLYQDGWLHTNVAAYQRHPATAARRQLCLCEP